MRSLASKLTVYILSLTLLILGLASAIMYHFNSAEVKDHAEKYATSLLKNTISDVSWDFKDVEHIMATNVQQVMAVLNSPDSTMAVFEDIITKENLIMGACVAFQPHYYPGQGRKYMLYAHLDADNMPQRVLIADTTAYEYHHKPWYADAVKSGKRIWSEPYYDKGCGNRLMTTYTIPLADSNGNIFGVFTADVSLSQLVDEINSLRTFDDDYTFVLTGSGNFVAHSSWNDIDNEEFNNSFENINNETIKEVGAKMVQGKSGLDKVTLGNDDLLICYAPLMVSDWSIGYACHYSSILASFNNFTVYTIAILLLIILLMIMALRWIIKKQIKPAEVLTEATYAISSGNFDTLLPEIKTNDEFKRLHDAFESMQISLKQYIKDLTEMTQAKQRISSELNIAHNIQMSLIPSAPSDMEYPQLQISALLRPAKEVGGDFYDYIFKDNKLYFTIADVSGKSVPASLIMATTRAHFRMMCKYCDDAQMIITNLNNALCEDNDANMFVTMFVGIINLDDYSFNFCNAGHNPAVLTDTSQCRFMEVTPNLPLGVINDFNYKGQTTRITPDSTMLFYTDGLTEAENTDHQLFGDEALLNAITNANARSTNELITTLTHDVEIFANGALQSDDLTLLAIKLNHIFRISNKLSELATLPQFVEEVTANLPLTDDERATKTNMLNLALEEALVNVINYAYPPQEAGTILLIAEPHHDHIRFTLIDSGIPFDPTTATDPDITASVEDRAIGGLGILLIRNIMDHISYRRIGPRNQLSMTFRP